MSYLLKIKNLFVFTLLIVIVSSCVPSKPLEEERVLPADRLIKKIEANRRKVKSFRGNGILEIDSPELSATASFEVVLKKPDSVSVSIFGPFGINLAQFFVTKDDFKFYDVMGNNLYIGEIKPDVLKKIFKVDLSFSELMDAFTGSVNLTDKLRNEPDMFRAVDGGYVLTYIDSTVMRESVYKIVSPDLSIINYRLVEMPKNILFEGRFSNFKMFEGIPIPFTTTIDYYERNQKVIIEYRNVDVNPKISNIDFNVPSDVNIIEW